MLGSCWGHVGVAADNPFRGDPNVGPPIERANVSPGCPDVGLKIKR